MTPNYSVFPKQPDRLSVTGRCSCCFSRLSVDLSRCWRPDSNRQLHQYECTVWMYRHISHGIVSPKIYIYIQHVEVKPPCCSHPLLILNMSITWWISVECYTVTQSALEVFIVCINSSNKGNNHTSKKRLIQIHLLSCWKTSLVAACLTIMIIWSVTQKTCLYTAYRAFQASFVWQGKVGTVCCNRQVEEWTKSLGENSPQPKSEGCHESVLNTFPVMFLCK